MRTQDLAVCRVNLDSTQCVFQVGDELTDSKKWHIVVCGKKENQNVAVVFSVDVMGNIRSSETLAALDGVEVSAAASHEDKVLIQSADKLILFKVEASKQLSLVKTQETPLDAQEKLIGLSNGVASVRGAAKVRTFDIGNQLQVQKQEIQEQATLPNLDAKSVLTKQIDASKITVDEIDRYERMMLGDGAQGASNSKQLVKNEVRHTWQAWEDMATVGSLDVKLQQPTSLIQLNIDV